MMMVLMDMFSTNPKICFIKMTSLILVLIAGMFNAIMDLCGRYDETVFSKFPKTRKFIDSSISWKNKYKNGDKNQGSRFLFSTKFLVFLTDMWHLSKTSMLLLLSLSIVEYNPIFVWYLDFPIYWIAFGTSFTIFYDYVLRLFPYWTKPW